MHMNTAVSYMDETLEQEFWTTNNNLCSSILLKIGLSNKSVNIPSDNITIFLDQRDENNVSKNE